jgi:Secretion system C-terminal sorting domain
MKGIIYLLVFPIFWAANSSFAQKIYNTTPANKTFTGSYPIDGTPIIEKQNEEVYKYFQRNPNALTAKELKKVTGWNFTIGTQKNFYAYDFTNNSRYQSSFTCRAVGKHCYIFVEDSLWGNRVDSIAVDSVVNAFDLRTPANPNKGVYEMDTSAFGQPPDVDGDPRIVILILNIRDGFKGSGGYTAGYFDSYNEMTNTILYPESNGGEFYYLDADPLNLHSAIGLTTAMSTTAHEFQHMINFNYHSSNPQMTFINEGCSKLAEIYCGYPIFDQSLYENETNYYLFGWRGGNSTLVLNDYSRAQRFFLYYWNHFGIGIFKYIVQSSQYDGIPLLNYALQQDGQTLTFNDVFVDWLIANSLNDELYNQYYGYSYSNLYEAHATEYEDPNESSQDSLYNLAADYITFDGGSNLSITFKSSNSSLIVKAIELGSGYEQVIDVPVNSEFDVPDYGAKISEITFVVINTNQSSKQSYSFQSSGSAINSPIELKWDNSEPVGYYSWSTSDTACVAFNAYPGAMLDSIKVALAQAGSIKGCVWNYTGVINPTPLGQKLSTPFTASISTSTQVPYPVPFQNWAKVDLRSDSIAVDKPFIVGFVIGNNSNTPAIMVTQYQNQGPYHSYTYLQQSDGPSSSGWYYVGSPDTVSIYLIHAYISYKTTTGIQKTVELNPSGFSLSQNYPNPFNPSTKIGFTLPKEEKVRIVVYNQLGQQIALLSNGILQQGFHEVNFNASNLPSGIYFYRIEAGGLTQTRKMVLLK